MMENNKDIIRYKVAGLGFEVISTSEWWTHIKDCYHPFVNEDAELCLTINIKDDKLAERGEVKPCYDGLSEPDNTTRMIVYGDMELGLSFDLVPPFCSAVCCRLDIEADAHNANITIDADKGQRTYAVTATLTSAMQLAYLIAATGASKLMAHSSCVVKDGHAYLFLGKSGTGKSTHSRMWLENLADVCLLNDDHPIIGFDDAGTAIAYGSPWSGKTQCYKNEQAPIGAIVRIKRAPYNAIHRQSPIQAYGSLMTSMSGISWLKPLSDSRHATIERLIGCVPCYELECLPDAEAAEVSSAQVTKTVPRK